MTETDKMFGTLLDVWTLSNIPVSIRILKQCQNPLKLG